MGGAARAGLRGRWEKGRWLVAPEGAHEEKGGPAKKKGENNKAPVGAYILGKNCRGRKRMRGNRRGKGQDDGNLPADILCVSCERSSLPSPSAVHSPSSTHPLLFLLPLSRCPPLFASLGSGLGPLITAGNHEIREEEAKRRFLSRVPSRCDINYFL